MNLSGLNLFSTALIQEIVKILLFSLGVCAGVNEDDMYSTAEELRKKIEALEFETVGHITGSFGVISVKENETATEAFERIDKALYDAKHGGCNRVVRG